MNATASATTNEDTINPDVARLLAAIRESLRLCAIITRTSCPCRRKSRHCDGCTEKTVAADMVYSLRSLEGDLSCSSAYGTSEAADVIVRERVSQERTKSGRASTGTNRREVGRRGLSVT